MNSLSSSSTDEDDEEEDEDEEEDWGANGWKGAAWPRGAGVRSWQRLCCWRGGSERQYYGEGGPCHYWVWKKWMKRLFTAACVGLHLSVQLYWLQQTLGEQTAPSVRKDKDWRGWSATMVWLGTFTYTTLPFGMWLVFEWLRTESSAAARQAGWVFFVFWASQLNMQCATLAVSPRTRLTNWTMNYIFDPGKLCMTLWAIWCRVNIAESAFEAHGAALGIALLPAVEVFVNIAKVLNRVYRGRDSAFAFQILDSGWGLFAYIAAGALAWWRFNTILIALRGPANILCGKKYLIAEASWAHYTLRRTMCGLVLVCFAGAVCEGIGLYRAIQDMHRGQWQGGWLFWFDVQSNIYLLFDFVVLLDTVGGFHPEKPKLDFAESSSESIGSRFRFGSGCRDSADSRGRRRSGSGDSVNAGLSTSVSAANRGKGQAQDSTSMEANESDGTDLELGGLRSSSEEGVFEVEPMEGKDPVWKDTVHALSGRYIEAGELLDFFITLNKAMPHFDPWVHTTSDIVRGAIVPLSLKGGRAMALTDSLVRASNAGDAKLLPERMVTHDWRNLFLHLVAAVVADSLGLHEYGPLAETLCGDSGQSAVARRLKSIGAANLRYWVCAFCVNQHAGICGSFGPPPPQDAPEYARWDANRYDTVTGQLHKLCSCGEPKFFSRASPERCEMNKFDDMMAVLNREVPNFKQLIAIDKHFDLFTRVWCVAELVEAHNANIPQNICLISKKALDANTGDLGVYFKLAMLTVADCSATCMDDKVTIMAKISDIAEFDAQLQAAIFGSSGLFGKELVGFDVVHAAARTALRVRVTIDKALRPRSTDVDPRMVGIPGGSRR